MALIGAVAASAWGAEKADKSKKTAEPAAAPAGVAATIGDQKITFQEVDAKAASALVQVRQQEYEARRGALDTILSEAVLDREAKAQGVSREDLLKKEVTDKVTDPPPADIDAYYEKNKARYGAQTKEQAAPGIALMLRQQRIQEDQRAYIRGLRQKYGVKVLLDAPRVQVAVDDDAAKGPATAPVTIVEFSDYQCPYCARAETVVEEVVKKYGDKVRLVYRDYPLQFHNNARTASMGAECAADQGKFWEMHKALFANQQKLAAADLIETAGSIGLDKDAFKTCLDSSKHQGEVQKDFEDGMKYGVTGTPTFFINGIPMVGARSVESFAEIIDSELERAR
jgi:protein-disulfide isomerase